MAHLTIRRLDQRRVRTVTGVMLILAAIAGNTGCGKQPLRLTLSDHVQRPEKCAVIFFADGLDFQRINELLEAGKLPNIEKRFVRGGVQVRHAVCSLPAMTYPNSVSIFTGCFPGHHGIMGNQLFDRDKLTWVDYITLRSYQQVNQDFTRPTTYDALSDHFTVNVQCPTHRGVTYSIDNMVETGPAWFLGWFVQVDEYVASCIEQVGLAAERVGKWPTVLTFYFPGLDQVGHQAGSHSAAYAHAMQSIDFQIGRVVDALGRAGLLEQSYLVLLTDHGLPAARQPRSFNLAAWLKKTRNLRCHEGDIPGAHYPDRAAFLNNYDIMLVDGSHRRVMLFVRGDRGWCRRPTAERIEQVVMGNPSQPEAGSLATLPCVEFVCTRDGPDRVRVRRAQSDALIERRLAGSVKEYRVTGEHGEVGMDLFGAAEDSEVTSFIKEGWHTSQEWLQRTADLRHPDFVPQIVEFFDSPRSGDIVIFLATDWLVAGHGASEHGSCLAEDMRIPLFFTGPDLPAGSSIECGRLVDVMPTILDLLGEHERLSTLPPIDGVSLANQLRAAETAP